MERESQYTISSVKTALKVLKLFDSAHKSMTLTENTERQICARELWSEY